MSKLFDATILRGLSLKNRFVRSATWEGLATPKGEVTPALIDTMTRLAHGEVGLIISGHTYVQTVGQASPWQLGLHSDDRIDGLTELTAAVHAAGGKIIAQLAHAGNFAAEQLTGQVPVVASAHEGLADGPRHELTIKDIDDLTADYAAAARRAKAAGFDGVQLHSAHGYLLSQFLSPLFNRRRDDFGGAIQNRCRLHLAVVRAVRAAVGADWPILMKINGQDYAEGGLELADSVACAKMLAEAGLDAIEISGGLLTNRKLSPSRAGIRNPDKEAYFRKDAHAFKAALSIPVILVGGMRSFGVAEQMVTEGVADYISMSRPLIREPDLIRRWHSGDRRPALCNSDNRCFKPAMDGQGVYCVTAVESSDAVD